MLSTQDIIDAIVRDIEDGRYAVGDLLPSEVQLQARFGTTRYRMREAMGALRKLGVIDSRAGVGTLVLARHPVPFFVQSQQTLESIVASANATQLRVRRAGLLAADERLAGLLRVAQGSQWFFIDTLRYLRGKPRPTGALWLYLRPDFAGVAEHVETWRGPVFKLIERMYGVQAVVVEQEIDAAPLSEALAAPLEAKVNSPCLQITRHWLDAQDKLLECSVGLYPQGRSRYRSRLPLSAGG